MRGGWQVCGLPHTVTPRLTPPFYTYAPAAPSSLTLFVLMSGSRSAVSPVYLYVLEL
jgi:hypothetical protein